MGQPVLLDTDILSEIIKGIDPIVVENAKKYAAEFHTFQFTSISVFEILHGLHRKNAKAQIQNVELLFNLNTELLIGKDDYKLAAQIAADLGNNGKPIGFFDPIIAACAIHHNLPVATGNTKHYQNIIDSGYPLILENWRLPSPSTT
jgi:predicted nucleic acid-binding protein